MGKFYAYIIAPFLTKRKHAGAFFYKYL